jgi:uncharacterized protein YcbX
MVDCATGRIDHDTLAALKDLQGHTNFGVYAVVTQSGRVQAGDVAKVVS